MADREKMSRAERAKQFMPFDALKGLQDALRVKESEHERIAENEVSEEEAKQISDVLLNLKDRDEVWLTYFKDGHKVEVHGEVKLFYHENKIMVGSEKINLANILKISAKEDEL